MKSFLLDHSIAVRVRLTFLLFCLLSLGVQPSIAQQYEFSTGPIQGKWIRGPSTWDGRHEFPNVYCASFPEPQAVTSLEEGLLNHDAISYFRVVYMSEGMAVFVITSTVPAGRSDATELQNLLARERNNAENVSKASPDEVRYKVATYESPWGTVIGMHLFNVAEHNDDGIFPLVRPLRERADTSPYSQSAHRLFVHRANRFEVAALGIPDDHEQEDSAARLETRLEAIADQVAYALQQCTSHMEAAEAETVGARPSTG